MSDVSMFFNEVFNIMYYFESYIVMRSQSYDHEVTVIGTQKNISLINLTLGYHHYGFVENFLIDKYF